MLKVCDIQCCTGRVCSIGHWQFSVRVKQSSCLVLINSLVISTLRQIASNKNAHNDSKHKREYYKWLVALNEELDKKSSS